MRGLEWNKIGLIAVKKFEIKPPNCYYAILLIQNFYWSNIY